ncbi:NAD(P)H-binding protein [Rhodococcoides corynebacterioides]|uniref:NAD(P)H-binding protein n=1 Tax=Rhodococcoides corynebacterioides TaxID=53972 RepID=UPI0008379998|nr:NAD(P)H-binding protein [Rhodococcus corynebacterioides]MBY6363726.1 NAD(P)H-binding protein [Rhodococcus corynebacterioides]
MKVFVTGASGYIGSRLVASLVADGVDVVVGSRTPERLRSFDWYDTVDAVRLDVTDADSCRDALGESSVDVAYYLVHAIGESGYRRTDLDSARHFAEAARDAGIGRIVYLGGFVPEGEELSEHLASRAEVGEALQVDGIEVVWLRAAIVIGAGSTSFEMMRYLADRLPVLPLPTWLNKPVQPIAVDDVVYYLRATADESVPAGAYDIAGPEVLPYRDLVFAYVRAARLHRLGVPTPPVPTALAGFVIGRLIPVPGLLADDLVQSLVNSMTASEKRIERYVPDPDGGLTGVDDAMRRSLLGAGHPRSVSRNPDALRLADSDAEWTGGDVRTIRRYGAELLGEDGWKLVEALGAGAVLYSWPIAPVVRTNLDVAASVVGTVSARVRSLLHR